MIKEVLPNGVRVEIAQDKTPRFREDAFFIRIVLGDKVTVALSPYDLTKGAHRASRP